MLDQNSTIMIVDDSRMMRNIIKKYLEPMGYKNLIEAETGKAALHNFEKANGTVKLIFMDIVMPVMDGRETLKEIRKIDKDVRVIMVSSITDNEAINECQKEGIEGYILKPIVPELAPKIFEKIVEAA